MNFSDFLDTDLYEANVYGFSSVLIVLKAIELIMSSRAGVKCNLLGYNIRIKLADTCKEIMTT